MKKSFNGPISRLQTPEERINEFKDTPIEIILTEIKRKTKIGAKQE